MQVSVPREVNLHFTFTDILGKQIEPLNRDYHLYEGKNLLSFGLSELSSGIYFARMEVGADVVTKRITITR